MIEIKWDYVNHDDHQVTGQQGCRRATLKGTFPLILNVMMATNLKSAGVHVGI